MRIDKYLANMNVGSRKEVHKLIKDGLVTVNGDVVETSKQKVGDHDEVMVGDAEIKYEQYHYFLMNKPKGVLSATEDRSQRTVISLLESQDRYQGITPVGRLDKNTTGLLLLTNDGKLNHALLAPNKHVDKVYWAKIAGVADESTVEKFAKGMTLGDGTELKSAQLKILKQDRENDSSEIEITISEGKYHQIKRMFGAEGMKVVELERLQMGKMTLGDLEQGEYRELSPEEVENIR